MKRKIYSLLIWTSAASCFFAISSLAASGKSYTDDVSDGPGAVILAQKAEAQDFADIHSAIEINETQIAPAVEDKKPKRGALIGRFKTTAYTSTKRNPITASGVAPKLNHTVGTNWKEIPPGTKIMIGDSDIVYTVEDTGPVVNTVDIFLATEAECIQYGVQYKDIYRVE